MPLVDVETLLPADNRCPVEVEMVETVPDTGLTVRLGWIRQTRSRGFDPHAKFRCCDVALALELAKVIEVPTTIIPMMKEEVPLFICCLSFELDPGT